MTNEPPTFTWPLPGHTRISGRFDDRRSYGPHNAIDIPAPLGTPYLTLAPGICLYAGPFGSCGLTVQIEHANRWRSHVCHLLHSLARTGDRIAPGATIGAVGSTGDSTGPHAHINIFSPVDIPGSRYVPWMRMWAVDPLAYICPANAPPSYYTVVRGDTASEIALHHRLTWSAFKALNPAGPRSGNWNLIYPGERFRVA